MNDNMIRNAASGLMLALLVFLSLSCTPLLEPQNESMNGGVQITIDDPFAGARTLLPASLHPIEKFTLTFAGTGDASRESVEMFPNETKTINLPAGEWTITAEGFANGIIEPIAKGVKTVTISSSVSTINIPVTRMDVSKTGTLRLIMPDDLSFIHFNLNIWKYAERNNPYPNFPWAESELPLLETGKTLYAGYYWMELSFETSDGNTFATKDVVHVFPELQTVWNLSDIANQYTITINGVYTENGNASINVYRDGSEIVNDETPLANGAADVSANNLTFYLQRPDSNIFTTAGDYVIELKFSDTNNCYLFTRGEAIGSYVNLPKYHVSRSTAINFDQFTKDLLTVTFDSNGGSPISPINGIVPGSVIALPAPPTKAGFDFAGWFTDDDTFFDSSTIVNMSITLFAKWTPKPPTLELIYTYTDNAYRVSAGAITSSDIVIPEKHNNGTNGEHPVTEIANTGFLNFSGITSVYIPDSVTTIGNDAFAGCGNLANINIPSGVTTIGNSAFRNCTNLTEIIIPDAVATIEASAFFGCSKLTSVVIGNGVTVINASVFSRCELLASIDIGNSVTAIVNYAFEGSGLAEITIPASVTSIGVSAFDNCANLVSVTFEQNNTSINTNVFPGPGDLGSDTLKNIYSDPVNGGVGTYERTAELDDWHKVALTFLQWLRQKLEAAPAGSETVPIPIDFGEFGSVSFTTDTTVPDGYIGWGEIIAVVKDYSKYVILDLTDCTAEGNTITGSYYQGSNNDMNVIWNNRYIKGINLPDNLQNIGSYAFNNCDYLDNITISNAVTSIGNYAFEGCAFLATVTLSQSIGIISLNTFAGCSSLASITIPTNVSRIEDNAFAGCTDLVSVTFEGNNTMDIALNAFPGIDTDTPGNLYHEYLYAVSRPGTYTRAPGGTSWAYDN